MSEKGTETAPSSTQVRAHENNVRLPLFVQSANGVGRPASRNTRPKSLPCSPRRPARPSPPSGRSGSSRGWGSSASARISTIRARSYRRCDRQVARRLPVHADSEGVRPARRRPRRRSKAARPWL